MPKFESTLALNGTQPPPAADDTSFAPAVRARASANVADASSTDRDLRDQRVLLTACPCCRSRRMHYAFSIPAHAERIEPFRLVRCADCRLMLMNPQPSDVEMTDIQAGVSATSTDVGARELAASLQRYQGAIAGRTLVVGANAAAIAGELRRGGTNVDAWNLAEPPAEGQYDACILIDAIDHSRDPLETLRQVRTMLAPNGAMIVATPSLDSRSARWRKRNWTGFRPEHLSYFDRNTLRTLLFMAGFERPVVVSNPSGDLTVVAKVNPAADAHPMHRRHTLSVVVPAFNEAGTVGDLLDAVLRKQIAGMEIEVIVVESNSSDGTREVVGRYANHPRVKVVLEDRPRGKGHAVRTGLSHATGDFVLIQDADLEYDLEDYDALLEPLTAGREALVLGSRHGGDAWWKMRQFESQPITSGVLNFGHWVFTTLVNVLFNQRLRDPFTMYKVFRRDCLAGLDLKCNRFDFDYELLIKMIRVGYKPIEIPVNYRSRSFKEGKKVRAFRDPINWLRALAWLRVVKMDPLARVAERAGTQAAARETMTQEEVRRAA